VLSIIDASGLIYRTFFAIRGLSTKSGEATGALFGFIRSLVKLRELCPTTHAVAVFDGPDNKRARLDIYPEYKAHRKPTPPELIKQIEEAKRFCTLFGLPLLNISGVEADDTIATLAKWGQDKEEISICSADKDLMQLVSPKVHIIDPMHDFEVIDEKKALEKWGIPPSLLGDFLALTGDSSDNIPGVSGLGPKGALQLLQTYGSLDGILNNADSISGKRGETIRKEKSLALLSKKLVTLIDTVPIPNDLSWYAWKEPSQPALNEFYKEKEFFSMMEGEKMEAPTQSELHILSTEEELKNALPKLRGKNPLCVDCETTSLNEWEAKLVGVGLCLNSRQVYYIPTSEYLHSYLQELLANRPLIGHNLKYDLHILNHFGIKQLTPYFDTLLASYLLNAHERRHGLDVLAKKYFHKEMTTIESLIGTGKNQTTMDKAPIQDVARYCGDDVEYTYRLYEELGAELSKRHLDPLFNDIEMPLLPILQKMEEVGVYINTTMINELLHYVQKELSVLEDQIFQLAGHPFTITSPKQLAVVLFDELKLPKGRKTQTSHSTGQDVLETLVGIHPIAEKLLTFRSLEKLRSTYLEVLPTMVNPETGRVHAHFHQAGTTTGRISCSDPNLQNIPVRTELGKKIRESFQAQKPNWILLSADYSQIELRILAHMCEDPNLLKAFQTGQDVHKATASELFGVSLDQVTNDMRRKAKAVNFGVIYGQQAYGLSQQLQIPISEAAFFIDHYFARYPRVKGFIEELKARAHKTGRATTLTGRERLLPDISSSNSMIRTASERLAVNTPFQGTSADIIKLAMIAIDRWMKDAKVEGLMILQIHDELLFEIPEKERELFKEHIPKLMSSVMNLKVPLDVDIEFGKNWGEC